VQGVGPLGGVKVIEIAAIGPAPFCAMMLADAGAEVIRVERARASAASPPPQDPLQRNRRSIALDLKRPEAIEALLKLIESADALLEGFRPGVMERLGIGPEPCLQRNPRLVYGRMTGWGQSGPLAQTAGHDIDYIALAGALHLIGPAGGKPVPPLNLLADFGGGGMLLAFGVLAALLEARRSGRGQIVDTSMVDGAVALLAMCFDFRARGWFRDATGENLLAGGAPYYDTYATRDGKHVAIGAIEPQFFAVLLEKLGLDARRFGPLGFPALDEGTRARWPQLRAAIAAKFAERTREEWCRVFEGSDACFAPVLTLAEAERHPHHVARGTFIEVEGVMQNAPAPRFSRTSAGPPRPPRRAGQDTEAVLSETGFTSQEIERLRAAGALG
jgi:alpha-methylacyl-CoA racemase